MHSSRPCSRAFLSLVAVAAVASQASGQTTTAVTITAGNVSYTQSALSLTETAGTGDNLNGGGGDILYQHWWWFRVAGDSREYAFKRDANATRTAAGPMLTTTWPDVDGRGLFRADLLQAVFSTSPTGGVLRETMQITNLSNTTPLTIDLFAYTDFDVAGSGTDLALGGLTSQVVVDQTNTILAGEFRGTNVSAAQVGAFATVRTLLTNTTVDNLAGWSGNFGPGDYTGAYQWSITVGPATNLQVHCQLATMSCRPDVRTYGTGAAGSNGVPTIRGVEYPVQDGQSPSQLNTLLENGAANSLALHLLNLAQGNSTLAGLQIWVDLNGAAVSFAQTDGAGRSRYALTLPPSPSFCGGSLYGQWLVLDPGGVGGLASHTGGLQQTIGGW